MTTQTEALKLALEALENLIPIGERTATLQTKAITAIKEALAQPEHDKERCVGCEACIDTACGRDECPKGWPKAAQPEQEPVAFYRCNGCGHEYQQMHPTSCDCMKGSSFEQVNYYTTPPQRTWVGLADEDDIDWEEGGNLKDLVKAIEAKLKEKNT